MEEYFDLNDTTAFVYLLAEGDDNNKLLISDDLMLIVRKKRRKTIKLEKIKELKTEIKKLLFPVILGGILTPFAFLSYSVNLFLPWIHLITVLSGMLLFYIGWTGSTSLTLVLKNGDEFNYPLPSISKNLLSFIRFVNVQVNEKYEGSNSQLLVFVLKKQFVPQLFNHEKAAVLDIFPLLGYTYEQYKHQKKASNSHEIIVVNPKTAQREIKFTYDPDTAQMRPELSGPISPDCREEFNSF